MAKEINQSGLVHNSSLSPKISATRQRRPPRL